jgi:site-specific recombinase XerD
MQGQTPEQYPDYLIHFTFTYRKGKIVEVSTTSPLVDHFLNKVKLTQSYHTWVNYAYDLKQFFSVVCKPLETINRQDCGAFMEQQDSIGMMSPTINRRLATMSSFFNELNLTSADRFPRNPVNPLWRDQDRRRRRKSLYRKEPERIPDIINIKDLQVFFDALPRARVACHEQCTWITTLLLP